MIRPSLLLASIGFLVGMSAIAAAEEPVDFNRDIRPILSNNCFACHGPNEKDREAELRLDVEQGAFAKRDELPAITPGDLSKSALWLRITSDDEDERSSDRIGAMKVLADTGGVDKIALTVDEQPELEWTPERITDMWERIERIKTIKQLEKLLVSAAKKQGGEYRGV